MILRERNYRPVKNSMAEPLLHTNESLNQMALQAADKNEKPFAIFDSNDDLKRTWPPKCLEELENELLSIGESKR